MVCDDDVVSKQEFDRYIEEKHVPCVKDFYNSTESCAHPDIVTVVSEEQEEGLSEGEFITSNIFLKELAFHLWPRIRTLYSCRFSCYPPFPCNGMHVCR